MQFLARSHNSFPGKQTGRHFLATNFSHSLQTQYLGLPYAHSMYIYTVIHFPVEKMSQTQQWNLTNWWTLFHRMEKDLLLKWSWRSRNYSHTKIWSLFSFNLNLLSKISGLEPAATRLFVLEDLTLWKRLMLLFDFSVQEVTPQNNYFLCSLLTVGRKTFSGQKGSVIGLFEDKHRNQLTGNYLQLLHIH